MNGWLNLVWQIADFVFKGAVAYARTPEGEKELNDITVAWEARANNDDQDTVSFSVDRLDVEPNASGQGGVKFAARKNG